MADELLFRLLVLLERLGVWPAVVAWLAVALGAAAMAYVLRNEEVTIWRSASLVGLLALAANLADYFVTLRHSPDLALEANPLWRNIVDHFGLRIAKWYGLTGKLFVSVLAAQMFAFYLSRRDTIYPTQAHSFLDFLLRMGTRAHTLRERVLGLFTIFAFFFAWINVFYFYIAYTNSLDKLDVLEQLPSVPVSALLFVAALAVAFSLTTYRAFRRSVSVVSERN
ncbi:MAG TPA: hypothetical protein VED66_17235 [Candidatus Sulfotelmatobacter sp.]|nr:hypothetical protein [Candidatus Sulfotelmatobacter sp.]